MLFESLNISQHFRTLYALVSRLTCSMGKVTAQHRKTPHRAAQRLSAWVAIRHLVQLLRNIKETKTAYLFRRVPLKNPEVYFFSCCLSGYLYRAATSPVEPPCISSDPFSERAGRTALREHRDFLGRAYARLNRGACSECTALCRRSAGFHHAQSKLLKNGRVRLCGIRSKDTADQIEGTMRALKVS